MSKVPDENSNLQQVQGEWIIKKVNRKTRQIAGYFTTADVDRYDESFEPGWFQETIGEGGNYYNNPVVLFNHDEDRVIGKSLVNTFKIDAIGVFVVCQISDDDIWAKILRGELNAFSWFGYVSYELKHIDLVEISVVSTPVNPKALFAIKKKALDLGLATQDDFPMPVEPKWKSIHLGPWTESEAVMAAMEVMTRRLVYRTSYLIEDDSTPKTDRITEVRNMLNEYGELCIKVMEALVPEQYYPVAKSLRGILVPADGDPVEEEDKDEEDEDMPLTAEEIAALTSGIGEAVSRSIAGLGEKLDQVIAAQTAPPPVAVPPAAVTLPAAPPAAAPPASPSVAPPESRGDAAAVSRGITDDDLQKIAVATVTAVMAANTTARKKGLRSDDDPAEGRKTKRVEAVKSLVGRVKETPYHGMNVEDKWRNHTLDAVAIEFAGTDYDSMGGGSDDDDEEEDEE